MRWSNGVNRFSHEEVRSSTVMPLPAAEALAAAAAVPAARLLIAMGIIGGRPTAAGSRAIVTVKKGSVVTKFESWYRRTSVALGNRLLAGFKGSPVAAVTRSRASCVSD